MWIRRPTPHGTHPIPSPRMPSGTCSPTPRLRPWGLGPGTKGTRRPTPSSPPGARPHRRSPPDRNRAGKADPMPEKNVVQTVHDTLWDEMKADDRVLVMGEDVGARGGVFRATAGFLDEFGEDRVIDTPLAESSIVGLAIGMALHGLRPVAEIQFADFIHPAFDQLVSEAARIRYRSNGDFAVPMVVRAPYGGGVHGALYHSQSVESLFAHVPGLKVVIPSTPADLKGLLLESLADPDPVLFLEHKKMYRSIKGPVPEGVDWRVPAGRPPTTPPACTAPPP